MHKQSPHTPTFNRDHYCYELTTYKHKTMATYTISHLAYIKVALHAAKYPHRQVNGVLLGNASADRTQVEVTGAIPLLHHWTSLSPSMEIGLDLVSLNT